mmetsp:Transcript_16811/g.47149  ORF Transcript_16811/g.47149 Transcript_16811/m.47149 type:complete len:247 (+) Transcript_16811:303-1043(+)
MSSAQICAPIMYSFANVLYRLIPAWTRCNASLSFLCSRSSSADFMNTRLVGARSRARVSSTLARSVSPVSHSSLAAASHTDSELGLTSNALVRMSRALSMLLFSHCSLARSSQKISTLGSLSLAAASISSRVLAVPCFRSKSTACIHSPSFRGSTLNACVRMARAVATDPLATDALASSDHVRKRSSSSTFIPMECFTIAPLVIGAPDASADSASSNHCALVMTVSRFDSDLIARSTTLSTISSWP